jgi:hypothetical protein
VRFLLISFMLTVSSQAVAKGQMNLYCKTALGGQSTTLPIIISDNRGLLPTKEEFNKIIIYVKQKGMVYCTKIPILEQIDYDPVYCTSGFYLPCRPYDLSIYDNCLLAELQKLTGLSESASDKAERIADEKCVKIARTPSWLDKLRYD